VNTDDVGKRTQEQVTHPAPEQSYPTYLGPEQEEEDDDVAFGTLVEPESVEQLRALQSKTWTWGVLSKGDCFCRHAALTLYEDGLGHFSAWTSTTSSGDVWLFKNIRLLGVHGDELYRIGQFNGPRMELTNRDYFVIRARQTNPLIFPQQLFPLIHSVTLRSHC
jgi:hypothetical protein